MGSFIYDFLKSIGYHHPVHPPFTHVPIGLIIAGLIFILLGWTLKNPGFKQTAKHMTVLAFVSAIPTIFLGYFDWQSFYAGAYILPIVLKMILGGLLLVVMGLLVFTSFRHEDKIVRRVQLHFFSFLLVSAIGYYGGELVYGKKAAVPSDVNATASVTAGSKLFQENCAICHFTDTTETKLGPGLKDLFKASHLPVSSKPVTEKNIEEQLKAPIKDMPAFKSLTYEQIQFLIAYLKTL